VLSFTPLLCAAVLWLVLKSFAADDVRDAPVYLLFYFVLGAAWVGLAAQLTGWLGISGRDDGLERGNSAATWACLGALLGVTFCFAGGNIGNGPGWWVVVFCAALATGALAALWMLIEVSTRDGEQVTVDRDLAAGIRLGAALAAMGLILGRSVAGDWHSATQTVIDFVRTAWPAMILTLTEVAVGRVSRPSVARPVPSPIVAGAFPAVLYMAAAAASVAARGWWT
jgi:uncharacterized membrane protein YjfL (UPF0719 family)